MAKPLKMEPITEKTDCIESFALLLEVMLESLNESYWDTANIKLGLLKNELEVTLTRLEKSE